MTDEQQIQIRITPVHKSLIRPQLMFGCDRTLVFLLLMATTLLMGPGGLGSGNVVNFAIGFVTLMIGIRFLASLAKYDPDAFEVFRRSMRFKPVYTASSCLRAKSVNYKTKR